MASFALLSVSPILPVRSIPLHHSDLILPLFSFSFAFGFITWLLSVKVNLKGRGQFTATFPSNNSVRKTSVTKAAGSESSSCSFNPDQQPILKEAIKVYLLFTLLFTSNGERISHGVTCLICISVAQFCYTFAIGVTPIMEYLIN